MPVVEWLAENKYNSFNSYKGLTYYENYLKILGWMDGKNELPPPIEASLDPVSACNNKCYYCNSQRYLRDNPVGYGRWGRDYMMDLLSDLCHMGVKAFCWGGGGESTLNPRLAEMNRVGHMLGLESSIITNGVHLDDSLIDSLLLCRWIGVSLDSADPATYKKVRGTDDCLTVLGNIKRLVARRTTTDISIKALLLPETIDTIYYTCQIAKAIGVQDFHVRPVDLERKDFRGKKQPDLDVDRVNEIFEKCHALENKDFHVYTVQHKFDAEFHNRKNDFKCLASPLLMQICTDQNKYVCVDHRLEDRFRVDEWGSDEHRSLLKSINPSKECSRCTFREYNLQMQAVRNDTLCRDFP